VTSPDATTLEQHAARIDGWLRAACAWRDGVDTREGVDMSAEAITARIRELAEMSSLCLELGEVGKPHRDGMSDPDRNLSDPDRGL
jgi:hypothetical protein